MILYDSNTDLSVYYGQLFQPVYQVLSVPLAVMPRIPGKTFVRMTTALGNIVCDKAIPDPDLAEIFVDGLTSTAESRRSAPNTSAAPGSS